MLINTGNSTEFYQYVNFAKRYCGRDVINRVLNNITVTRPFTVYQLADIVINQLPKVNQQYDAKMVVVCDLLDMFIHDPQIEADEATYLINETINSITKSKALEDVIVIVSLSYEHSEFYRHHHAKLFMLYSKTIFPRFDKCIEIMNGKCKLKK